MSTPSPHAFQNPLDQPVKAASCELHELVEAQLLDIRLLIGEALSEPDDEMSVDRILEIRKQLKNRYYRIRELLESDWGLESSVEYLIWDTESFGDALGTLQSWEEGDPETAVHQYRLRIPDGADIPTVGQIRDFWRGFRLDLVESCRQMRIAAERIAR